MSFLKRNIWTLTSIAFIALLSMSGFASAATTDLMGAVQTKTSNVFQSVKTIIFIVGGFGLVAVAFMAIFGKVNWKWFAGLAVGLAILAAAGAIVSYATEDTAVSGDFNDSFTGNVQ